MTPMTFNEISQLLIWIILPWAVWVTKGLNDMKQAQAVNKVLYESIKEDIQEIKDCLQQLIEIQGYAHPRSSRKRVPKRKN